MSGNQIQATQQRSAAESESSTAAKNETGNPQWGQLVSELLACTDGRDEDSNEMLFARYLSGNCSDEERLEIEQIISQSPELADCIARAREVFQGKAAAA